MTLTRLVAALASLTLLAGCVGSADESTDPPASTGKGELPYDPRNEGPLTLAPAQWCRTAPPVPSDVTGGWFNATFGTGLDGFVGDCALDAAGAEWGANATGGALALAVANGSGAVWAERAVKLAAPRVVHDVDVTFRARSTDAGVQAIAFVGMLSPYAREHFTPHADGATTIPGAVQLRQNVSADGEWETFRVTGKAITSSDGVLYVAVGFTSADAGGAAVQVDDVRVRIG